MKVLVTGGAGYIGSHTCVELLAAGFEVVVVDNLSNSSATSLERVEEISGKTIAFEQVDLRDQIAIEGVFKQHRVEVVLHFAGKKAVAESHVIPLNYYQNNVAGTLNLCAAMAKQRVHRMIFSSSATVYGQPESVPIKEHFPTRPTNPYARTKLFIEKILEDLAHGDDSWQIVILRYFNPVGAHRSGLIGEHPAGIPNNLMPFVSQVAIGRLPELLVFGDDYATPDGTGVRDYIHVVDLARAHVRAIMASEAPASALTLNIGTGTGYSVLEMVEAFERNNGVSVPYRIVERRPGDVAYCYADPSMANQRLSWVAERGLDDMVADTWRWQRCNPQGYDS